MWSYFFVFFGLGCALLAVYSIKRYGNELEKEYHDHH